MKKTGVCPKCGGADIVRVPGGVRSTMDNTQNFVIRGFQSAPVDRYICCACGFSEEWLREQLASGTGENLLPPAVYGYI
ncbi:hypothetical protein, partial [Dysosmobacter sp.]|uniref:hypothetical protein n=1 Tax=Dysosmobacter sp. TaxID=2591382 RepID=UPI003AB4A8AD